MVDKKDETKDKCGRTEPNGADDAIPEDMNELFCDVDEEAPSNSLSQSKAPQNPIDVEPFRYPSKEAKKDDLNPAPTNETSGIPDDEELYCDVDEETQNNSLSTGSVTTAPIKVAKTTSKSIKYPTKEAKIDASAPEERSKIILPQKDQDHIHKNTATNNAKSHDTLTHRMKSKMKGRRRRNRRDYGSDEESDPSESDNDVAFPRIGAVAVDSTGVVPQRPGVLTQPDPSLPISSDDDEFTDEEMQTTTDGGDTWIDATVETAPLSRATTAAGDLELKNPIHDAFPPEESAEIEKLVDLPWYWSRFFWIMMAVLVVALGVIVTVVLVVLGKKDPTPAPTPSPTVTPIDRIKAEAFQRYIGAIGNSEPQLDAYQWLTTEDEITNFSESMTQDDVDVMKTRYSLAVLYFALGGENWWSATDWLGIDVEHCQWRFVSCPEGLTGLFLENNNLQGTIPSELAYLSTLEYLILNNNKIESVKGLENNGVESLKWLDLSYNPLNDHETVFQLTNLETLLLYNTEFSGTLPVGINQLSNLKILNLWENKLTGPLNNRFRTMSNLQDLIIGRNQFNATLEDILDCGDCSNTLTRFLSDQNPLVASIPDRLFEFTKLTSLWVSNSRLTGTIPTDIGKLSVLEQLHLLENFYFSNTTVLPTELGNLHQLRELLVSDSAVGGTVPTELANLSNLQLLRLGRTMQTGSIPQGICDIPSLQLIEHGSRVECNCPGNVCVLVTS